MDEQLSIFDCLYPNFKITKPIRLIELFSGVGSQAMALRDIEAKFEHWKVVEFDKFAINSYNAIHGTDFPTMDIRDIHSEDLNIADRNKYTYIMTYSFPCQDLSKAGKQRGMTKGSGTRSGLLWEVERILNECKEKDSLPQVLLMENVPDVIGTKNYEDFMKWYAALENMGYQSYYKVLNAKDYGIPQNRERCFMVSILGGYNYTFPKPIPLELRLKDMLEESVDEKYYISNSKIESLLTTNFNCSKFENVVQDKDGISSTLCARDYKDPKCVVVGNTNISKYESSNRIYSPKGISPTINTMQGGNLQPKIAIKENTKKGYDIAIESICQNGESSTKLDNISSNGKKSDGICEHRKEMLKMWKNWKNRYTSHRWELSEQRYNEFNIFMSQLPYENTQTEINMQDMRETDESVRVLRETLHSLQEIWRPSVYQKQDFKIRKLTPRECWRLQGFTDEDFEKAQKVNSNTQLYKQAGNSIVKNVLMEIFKQMIGEQNESK